MKILHIISSLENGGAQRLVHDMAILQKEEGNDVTILVYNLSNSKLEKELFETGVLIQSLDASNIYNIKIIFEINRRIKHFDIVHVHLFPSLYQVALSDLFRKTKKVYTEHSTFNKRRKHRVLRFVERFVYSRYDSIISISKQTQSNLIKWLKPKTDDKFSIVENGVNLEMFNDNNDTIEHLDTPYILMISRFAPAKDQASLIKAIPLLNNKELLVYFAGEGETLDDNITLAKSLNVYDRCRFLGNRDDIPELIKKCSLGIQSSNWEGFGLTAVELMACRKPVVASDVEGLRDVVDGAGLLFEKGNPKDLADKINKLMEDPKLYEETACKCKKRSHQYSIDQMYNRYNEIYRSILTSSW